MLYPLITWYLYKCWRASILLGTTCLVQHSINFITFLHFKLSKKKNHGLTSITENGLRYWTMLTSSGVCSPRSLLPSKRKAIDWKSTDCLSQYAFMSFFSWVLRLILKNTSFPSYIKNNVDSYKHTMRKSVENESFEINDQIFQGICNRNFLFYFNYYFS